jgi:hypothetical protein
MYPILCTIPRLINIDAGVFDRALFDTHNFHEDVQTQHSSKSLFSWFFPDGSLPVNRDCGCCNGYDEWSANHSDAAVIWDEYAANFSVFNYCAELVQVVNCGSNTCNHRGTQHSHRGTFRPSWPTRCSGCVTNPELGLCDACAWLLKSHDRGNFFKSLGWKPTKPEDRAPQSPIDRKLRRIRTAGQATSIQINSKASTKKQLISNASSVTRGRDAQDKADKDLQIMQLKQELAASIKLDGLDGTVHTLIKLCKKGLARHDKIFLESWLSRTDNPQAPLHEMLKDLSILCVDNQQAQMYDTLKPYLKLPDRRNARQFRRRDPDNIAYTPGVCDAALEHAEVKFKHEAVVSEGDGTRIVRMVERLYGLLVGRQYPPRPSQWPKTGGDPVPNKLADLVTFVSKLREPPTQLAHEVYTEAFTCITDRSIGMLPYILVPEATSGFNGAAALEHMLKTAELSFKHNILCVGNCTDFCSSFSCGAGALMNTPTVEDVAAGVYFLGLDVPEYRCWARHLGTKTIRIDGGEHTIEYF